MGILAASRSVCTDTCRSSRCSASSRRSAHLQLHHMGLRGGSAAPQPQQLVCVLLTRSPGQQRRQQHAPAAAVQPHAAAAWQLLLLKMLRQACCRGQGQQAVNRGPCCQGTGAARHMLVGAGRLRVSGHTAAPATGQVTEVQGAAASAQGMRLWGGSVVGC